MDQNAKMTELDCKQYGDSENSIGVKWVYSDSQPLEMKSMRMIPKFMGPAHFQFRFPLLFYEANTINSFNFGFQFFKLRSEHTLKLFLPQLYN